MLDAVRANHRAKNQRRRTVNNLGKAEKIEEVMESVARKLKRTLTLNKSTTAKVKELEQQAMVAGAMQRRNSFPPSSLTQTDPNATALSSNEWKETISNWASTIGADDDFGDDDDVVEVDDPSSGDDSLQELWESPEDVAEYEMPPQNTSRPLPEVSQAICNDLSTLSSFACVSRPNRNFERCANVSASTSCRTFEDRGDVLSVENHMTMPLSSYSTSRGNDGPRINFPAIQRNSFPVVITESEDDVEDPQVSNYFEFSYPNRESGFSMAPPPRSTSFVNSWS
jgi:hypothetical protein